MNTQEEFAAQANTLASEIMEGNLQQPVAVLVPACMTVVLNGVLSAPDEQIAQAMLTSVRSMVDYIEQQMVLQFASPAGGQVH